MPKFNRPLESPSLSRVIDPFSHTDNRRVVQRLSAFNSVSAVNSALEDVNSASEAMDSVTVGNSLSMPMDSFQLGEEKNERGTGGVVYFRTYSDRVSRKEHIHWYALPIEENSSNPNPSPPSENKEYSYCLPDYPTPPKILQPFSKTDQSMSSSAVGLGSSIYVLGGRSYVKGIGEIYATNKVYKYDTADLNPEWKEVCPMQRERAQFSAAVLDGKIYVQGGLNVEETELHERDSGWVEYLDPEIGRWEILPPVKIDGKDKSLHRILNPNCEQRYFTCTMTPLGADKLVFSSDNSPSPSYVYNIRDGSLVEMVGEKDFIKFHRYEAPVMLGNTRYYVCSSTGVLFGYRFDKFTWATNSHTPAFLEREYPRKWRVNSFHTIPRVDGSSIASQGNQCYVIWVHHFHNSYYEIRCKPIVVSHDIETSANNSEAPFELLDVRIKPSICRFISAGDNLLDGLVLDKVIEKKMVEGVD